LTHTEEGKEKDAVPLVSGGVPQWKGKGWGVARPRDVGGSGNKQKKDNTRREQ